MARKSLIIARAVDIKAPRGSRILGERYISARAKMLHDARLPPIALALGLSPAEYLEQHERAAIGLTAQQIAGSLPTDVHGRRSAVFISLSSCSTLWLQCK